MAKKPTKPSKGTIEPRRNGGHFRFLLCGQLKAFNSTARRKARQFEKDLRTATAAAGWSDVEPRLWEPVVFGSSFGAGIDISFDSGVANSEPDADTWKIFQELKKLNYRIK